MTALETCDVLVIGGGACGCTAALFLREEGASVVLVDKGSIGREASWASAGMVGAESCAARDPWFVQATQRSKKYYDHLHDQLLEMTGQRVGYGGEGHIVIARDDLEVDALKDRVQGQQQGQIEAHLLSGSEAREREPALPPDVVSAAWMPGGRFLDARQYTFAVAAAARISGVGIREGFAVNALRWSNRRVVGVCGSSGEIHAGTVINAAGAWAGRIDPTLPHPVYPRHGQVMSIAATEGGLRHNVSRANFVGYVTPRADGRVIVGATHDDWGYTKKLTPEGLGFLGQVIQNVLPGLGEQPVLEMWSGLRPATADGLPTVGADPRTDGGYLWATGHGANGMMQMPATARVVTELALDRPLSIGIEQLSIERFLGGPQVGAHTARRQFMSVE